MELTYLKLGVGAYTGILYGVNEHVLRLVAVVKRRSAAYRRADKKKLEPNSPPIFALNMHLSKIAWAASLLPLLSASVLPSNQDQIPFQPREPAPPSTPLADPSNLIFASFSGLLKQWPNTFYPNGHSVILGTILTATQLYHDQD